LLRGPTISHRFYKAEWGFSVPVDESYFTKTEISILRYIALGLQSKEIAEKMGRSKPTIESYVRLMCAKLGARSRAHLVARGFSEGLLTSADTNSAQV